MIRRAPECRFVECRREEKGDLPVDYFLDFLKLCFSDGVTIGQKDDKVGDDVDKRLVLLKITVKICKMTDFTRT